MPTDRRAALRVLGFDAAARPDRLEIENAYWRLRAHLERRAAAASSEADRQRRLAEIAELEAALPRARSAQPTRSWGLGFAIVASTLALLLSSALWWIWRSDPSSGAAAGGGGGTVIATGAPAGPAAAPQPAPPQELVQAQGPGMPGGGGPPAILVAKANLEGSHLTIDRVADGQRVYDGPADDREHTLPAGRYVLRASNQDCADVWESEVLLEPEERRTVEAKNCERNGWLVVRSNVSGDAVSIDARAVGPSGPTRHPVSVGEHRVVVQKEGYVPWEGVVRVEPAEVVPLKAQLFEAAAEEEAVVGASDDRHTRWHDGTREWLLQRYDFDDSGRLDREEEVVAIECRDLQDIEGTFDRAELKVPMTRFFGFDGSEWVDGALGFDSTVRAAAYEHMVGCGLRK